MDHILQSTLIILQKSLWGTGPNTIVLEDAEGVYSFINEHAIFALPAGIFDKISMSDALRIEWKNRLFKQLYTYQNIVYVQGEVLKALKSERIPVVVLKGTSASQYYPVPQYRVMGDIDLLVKKEDFDRATETLLSCGYVTNENRHKNDRHITLVKRGISIELHRRYASEYVLDDPVAFDNLLFDDIADGCTVFSEPINGLVLLEHIAQHLNEGIGFRQIIDWMLYVDRILTDEMWEQRFRELAKRTGLEKLALSITRMCQLYLGLRENGITWCRQADADTCEALLKYIADCGNFGHSREAWEIGEITQIPSFKHPILLLRYIQKRGLKNWPLAQQYAAFKPFAWIYQSVQYIKKAMEYHKKGVTVKTIYDEGERRRLLFQSIGIEVKNRH